MTGVIKPHETYERQVALLTARGMDVGDRTSAMNALRRVNYYRLSGYWYPFRQPAASGRLDDFLPGTALADVIALYEFDARLRTATFSALGPIELAIRALLGYELGRTDPCAHLDPALLGPTARQGGAYTQWSRDYEAAVARSREDFVVHHRDRYGGRLPVWAAVEVLGWGSLATLYGFAPRGVQDAVASSCGLSAPQLTSWLKSLNIVRNICAHHGRLFNRVHTIKPKLPRHGAHPDLDAATTNWNRTFGQLTLIQFLLDRLEVGRTRLLPAVVMTYPSVPRVPLQHLGADPAWRVSSTLWSTEARER